MGGLDRMKRRLSMVISTIGDPKIIFMDEVCRDPLSCFMCSAPGL